MRPNRLLRLAAATLLAGCGTMDAPTVPATGLQPRAPRHTIDDWSHYGTEQFYFLPATLPSGSVETAFDGTLSPTITLCRVTNGTCGPTIASWTRTSGSYGRTITVNTTARSYTLSWPTSSTGVSAGQVYRATVTVAGRQLGYEDVKFVSTSSQLGTVDATQYRGAVVSSTFAITFRINQGIPGSITLSASSLNLTVGGGQAITVTLRDLHGNVMTSPWLGTEIDNETQAPGQIAQLDSGMVVANFAGTATFWAWIADLEVSIPVTVTDNRRPWTVQATPDDQGLRGVWGTSATNVYAASYTGILHYNGTAWAHESAPRWRTLNDVFGFAANDVWAAGDQGLLLHWNGSAWSASRFDGTSVQPASLSDWSVPARKLALRGLWGIPGLLVAVGDSGTAMYYDGSTWTAFPTGVTANLTSIWGSGTFDWYATTSDGRLLHYNGALSAVSGVTAPGAMNSVWGSAGNNVYVVGDGGLLYRYNGSSWTRIRLPTRANLYAVWGTSASNVFVAGENGSVYRYDGTSWTPEKIATGSNQIYAFWGDGGTNLFAAGAGGMIARR